MPETYALEIEDTQEIIDHNNAPSVRNHRKSIEDSTRPISNPRRVIVAGEQKHTNSQDGVPVNLDEATDGNRIENRSLDDIIAENASNKHMSDVLDSRNDKDESPIDHK